MMVFVMMLNMLLIIIDMIIPIMMAIIIMAIMITLTRMKRPGALIMIKLSAKLPTLRHRCTYRLAISYFRVFFQKQNHKALEIEKSWK